MEPGEYLHHVVYLFLGLGQRPLQLHLFIQIQDSSAQHELLLLVALIQSFVV